MTTVRAGWREHYLCTPQFDRMTFVAAILGCVGLLASCASVTPEAPAEVKTMRINSYDLKYVEQGTGVPVVLVHGSLSDYRSWAAQMAPLAERYRVIALSLRHYYPEKWDGKGNGFSIEQHAKDVIAFIESLNAGKVHLVAHSRGGNVGLHVAKWKPDLLRSVVLADASGLEGLLPKAPEGAGTAASGTAARAKLQQRLLAGEIDKGLAEYVDFANGPGTWSSSTEENRQVRRENAWTIIGDVGRPQTTCEEGVRFSMPTLLMNGEFSPPRYLQMFDIFQVCAKGSQRTYIPKASHGMFRTHPELTNAAILTFLSRN